MSSKASTRASVVAVLSLLLLGVPALGPVPAAQAHWLTHLLREAGEAGGKGATHLHPNPHLGAIGKAAGALGELPAGRAALAAHVTPEGHWQFANREGQVFTAGTPEEMSRAATPLLPGTVTSGDGKLALYLSEESAFAEGKALDELPKGAELNLVTGTGTVPLLRTGDKLSVRTKPNVTVELADRVLFDETLSVLARRLNTSEIRTIALEPGAAKTIASAPRLDATSKAALVDQVDPAAFAQALGGIRGQTALIVGRVEGATIAFRPSSGGEVVHALEDLRAAARRNDVNLVVLHAETPRQPGGRNWLWQRIEVGGLGDALEKATFGDFLDALGARRAPMRVSAVEDGLGRVRLNAVPEEGATSVASETVGDLLGHVTGEVVTKAVEIGARDDVSQKELDARIIPGIPTYVQMPYFMSIIAGLIGSDFARHWWRRIWPPPARREGEGRLRHVLAATPNFLAYLLLFLPLAGLPAFLAFAARQAWSAVTAPVRLLRRLFRRRAEV